MPTPVAAIDGGCRPSTVADDVAGDAAFRTSSTCDLSPEPLVDALDLRIAAFSGLDYHADCAIPGQRTWTAMIYLNEPAAGGATRFKRIDKTVAAETGKLLAWNNLTAEGWPNGMTLHQGMKVRAGAKYVVTKWFRERPWPRA